MNRTVKNEKCICGLVPCLFFGEEKIGCKTCIGIFFRKFNEEQEMLALLKTIENENKARRSSSMPVVNEPLKPVATSKSADSFFEWSGEISNLRINAPTPKIPDADDESLGSDSSSDEIEEPRIEMPRPRRFSFLKRT